MVRETIPIPADPITGTVSLDGAALSVSSIVDPELATFVMASTEQTYLVSSATKFLYIYNRGPGLVSWARVVNGSGLATAATLRRGNYFVFPLLGLATSFTIYWQASIANTNVEILRGE